MKPVGRPVVAAFKRAYAAQAQAARSAEKVSLPKQEPKITRLPNGEVVASLENYSPISRVAIVYNAGPRFESGQQLGITHSIRNAVSLSTENASGFGITRSIQQAGGTLGCTTTREHMFYSLECVRKNLDSCVEFLGHAATSPAFRPWEVMDAAPRLKLDLALLAQNPHTQLIEALHKAAYRDTLGNSLYMPAYKVGKYSPDQLQSFVTEHYTCGNMAYVGVGVDHDQLLSFAKNLNNNRDTAPAAAASKFHGGEIRVDTNSSLVHAAVVTEGAGLASKDFLTVFLLQKIMGSGPSVKYGSDLASNKVSKAAAQGTTSPFAARSIAASYSDSGLFGFQVVAQAADMDKVMRSITATFAEATKGGITEEDVQRGKAQLKATIAMELESGATMLEQLALQSLQVVSATDIDQLTLADVQNVAKKVINGKPAMAAVGDLHNTPYLDQLF